MSNKILKLLFITLALLITLIGCTDKGDSSEQNQQGGASSDSDEAKTLAIVIAEDFDINIAYDIGYGLSNYKINFTNDPAYQADVKLYIGDHDVELVQEAKTRFTRLKDDFANNDDSVAYLIYSDGKSVVVYYDSEKYGLDAAKAVAVEKLKSSFISGGDFTDLKAGVVHSEVFDIIEYQAAIDDKMVEEQWAQVEAELVEQMGEEGGADTLKALRNLYNSYSDSVISWFANLYDPITGGYYYSNSARDNIGFAPDVESTAQALGFIRSSGMANHVDKDLTRLLPVDMQKGIINWVKGLQSPDNGYFYHPQWGKASTDANAARLGRDVGMATSALEYLGALPTYDAPNGVSGDGIAPTPVSLTSRLCVDNATAVSRVVAVSNYSGPGYLKDKASFELYLSTIDINANSYVYGNVLESQASQIYQRDNQLKEEGKDYGLCDILCEWLGNKQNKTTGLWTNYDHVDYEGVNGLLKISSVYQKINKPIPNITIAAKAALQAISFDEPQTVCFWLNPWYALSLVFNNAKRHYSKGVEAEELDKIRQQLYNDYPDLVDITMRNIAKFAKQDGSYSFQLESSASTSQGMPVALRHCNEGDVNATIISITSITNTIMDMLGYGDRVPIYTRSDWMKYLSILEDLGAIIKNEDLESEPLDFENESVPVEINYNYSADSSISVIDDNVYGTDSKVLNIVSRPYSSAPDETEIFITSRKNNFNAVAFEADVKFTNYGETNAAFDLNFCAQGDNAYTLQLYAFNEYSGTGGWESDSVFISHNGDKYRTRIAAIDEYFNLRIEYCDTPYDYTGDGIPDFLVCIYVNGHLVASGNTPYRKGTVYSAQDINKFELLTLRGVKADIRMDNMAVEQTYVDFEPGVLKFNTARLPLQTMPELSESGSTEIKGGGLVMATVSGGSDRIKLYPTRKSDNLTALAFESDLAFYSDEGKSSVYELAVRSGTANVYNYKLIVTDENYVGTDYDAGFVYLVGTKDSFKIKLAKEGENFTLRTEYMNPRLDYTGDGNPDILVRISLNGERIATGYNPISQLTVPDAKAITGYFLTATSDASGSVRLDNLLVEQCAPLYDEGGVDVDGDEGEQEPPITDYTGGYTFEDGLVPSGVSTPAGNSSGVVRNNINGEYSMVYAVAMTTGRGETVFSLTKTAENKNSIVFEAMMKLDTTIQSNGIEFWLGDAYRFDFLIYDGDDESYALSNKANAGLVRIGRAGGSQIAGCTLANEGEWFKFKIEYTVTETERIVNIYVNDKRVDGESTSGSYSLDGITTAKFLTYTTVSTDAYFDNVKVEEQAIDITSTEPEGGEDQNPDEDEEEDEDDDSGSDSPTYNPPNIEDSPFDEGDNGGWTPERD